MRVHEGTPPGLRVKPAGTCIDCRHGEVSIYQYKMEVGCNLYWYPVSVNQVCDSWKPIIAENEVREC
jgi:hypothetical protein